MLSGKCKLLVDGQERLLRPWDFFHCPAGTEHVFVGAGDGPSVILMTGPRTKDEQLFYPHR
jgi:quercetin dioxygenase-like cupin family protein